MWVNHNRGYDPFDPPTVEPEDSKESSSHAIEGSIRYKMMIGALLSTVVIGIAVVRLGMDGNNKLNINLAGAVGALVGSARFGAFLGALLGYKDQVEQQEKSGRRPALIARLLFGKGLVSLLLVWIPLIVFCVLLLILAATLSV